MSGKKLFQAFFSDHNGIKLKNHRKKNGGKKTDHMEIKQHGTKNKLVNDEIKEEIRNYFKTKDNDNTTIHNLWNAAKVV